jgi:hypothetical protein
LQWNSVTASLIGPLRRFAISVLQSELSSDQHRGKFLQLHLTIEDEGVFTVPWTATLTHVPARNDQLREDVYAENMEFYPHKNRFQLRTSRISEDGGRELQLRT